MPRSSQQDRIRALINRALRLPASIPDLAAADLDLLIRVLRRARLLGRVGESLADLRVESTLPADARDQVASAVTAAEARIRVALWELDRIEWALADTEDVRPVVMKGCAYVLAALPNASGRPFADVDILVRRSDLDPIETRLTDAGWKRKDLSRYDDNYYRNWTHELPPVVHSERGVEVDIHHTILPPTSRLKPDGGKILASSRELPGSIFRLPSDVDLTLHAIAHLFFDSDFDDRLRDLVDVDDLIRHYEAGSSDFWTRLLDRAEELDLRRPAYYALRYREKLLESPVPESVSQHCRHWGPPGIVLAVMDRLIPAALYPAHPERPPGIRLRLARLALFVRYHWVRMPPWLLLYHFFHKTVAARFERT